MSGDPFDWRPSAGVRTMQQRRVNNMPMAQDAGFRFAPTWWDVSICLWVTVAIATMVQVRW